MIECFSPMLLPFAGCASVGTICAQRPTWHCWNAAAVLAGRMGQARTRAGAAGQPPIAYIRCGMLLGGDDGNAR